MNIKTAKIDQTFIYDNSAFLIFTIHPHDFWCNSYLKFRTYLGNLKKSLLLLKGSLSEKFLDYRSYACPSQPHPVKILYNEAVIKRFFNKCTLTTRLHKSGNIKLHKRSKENDACIRGARTCVF